MIYDVNVAAIALRDGETEIHRSQRRIVADEQIKLTSVDRLTRARTLREGKRLFIFLPCDRSPGVPPRALAGH